MAWSDEYDMQVVELMKQKETVEKGSEAYLRIQNQAANILLNHLKPELASCVRMWKVKFNIDESDGESLIYDNLLKSLEWFEPKKTVGKFTSFFWHVNSCFFKNYLTHMYAKKRTPQVADDAVDAVNKKVFLAVHSLSSPAPFSDDEGRIETLENVIADPYSFEKQLNTKLILKEISKKLTHRQRHILKRVIHGYGFTDIGKRLNVPLVSICNEVRKIKGIAKSFEKDL